MFSSIRQFISMGFLAAACGLSASAQQRTILAIGAHAADMDLTAGAILAHQKKLGDRVVILHMTLGEAGNPNMPPAQYAEQKRREAIASGEALGAEVIIGPYADAMLPNDEEARKYVADIIRQVKPTYVVTHWKNSFHKDHRNTHAIVVDAVLMAELEAVKTAHPPYRGLKGVFYADNWEDSEDFKPYIFVDVSDVFDQWKQAIRSYQMVRGGVSPFDYFDYYTAHLKEEGALVGKKYAVSLDVDESSKRRILDSLR
jgi:LmbE family N-acetylglucosaminyl deacetylase